MRALTAKQDTREADEAVLRYVFSTEFYLFCQYYDSKFFCDDKPHLKIVCDALQRITEQVIRFLMITLPPRSGKSYTMSLWCAWMIGRGAEDPDMSIMRNSYGQTLAEKFSYDIRAIIQSPKFLAVFPGVMIKRDHARIEDWAIIGAKESTYFCAGVDGSITGKGARTVAALDDPVKDMKEALSTTVLDTAWLWYKSTHQSRMERGCPEVHIGTRWSRNDPMGRILASPEGDKYEQIVFPALDGHGRSFCEKVHTTDEYLEMKHGMDEFIWEAEYMQNPVEAKGLLFPPDQLHRFTMEELSADLVDAVIGFTDTADEGADFLASPSVALSGSKAFLVDVVFTQEPIEITEALVARQIIDNGHSKHVVESNNGGKSFARNVRKLIEEHYDKNRGEGGDGIAQRGERECRVRSLAEGDGSDCHITWQPSTKNKETRILMSSGQIKRDFWFRSDYEHGSMYDRFMRQLTSYVKMGTNQADDAPDALTGVAEQVFRPGMRFLSTSGKETN